jgi:cytochrome oxidase Cu insertion factor (SCO1/SenC/PrrC family)
MERRILRLTVFLFLAVLVIHAQQATPQPNPKTGVQTPPSPPKTHLKVGQPAPDFTLTDTTGKPVKLSDFKGKKNVVLAFYVLAFTGG